MASSKVSVKELREVAEKAAAAGAEVGANLAVHVAGSHSSGWCAAEHPSAADQQKPWAGSVLSFCYSRVYYEQDTSLTATAELNFCTAQYVL